MAKRSRVPAHKSLPEGQTNRNKNPKLSPYQRELKRNRLANQAPHVVHQKGGGRGAAGLRDEPAKARDLIKYLNAKNEYEAEKVRVKANRIDHTCGDNSNRRPIRYALPARHLPPEVQRR